MARQLQRADLSLPGAETLLVRCQKPLQKQHASSEIGWRATLVACPSWIDLSWIRFPFRNCRYPCRCRLHDRTALLGQFAFLGAAEVGILGGSFGDGEIAVLDVWVHPLIRHSPPW